MLALMGIQNADAKLGDNFFVDPSVQDGEILSQSVNKLDDVEEQYHLFSHGRSGELFIDGSWHNADQIVHWLNKGGHLAGKSTLAIYGCEFAKGNKGKAAVDYLKSELGISVAASDDITGRDGDWELEVGKTINHLQLANYPGNLNYIYITPEMFGLTGATAHYSNGSFEDISSHLGLPGGSVRVELVNVDIKTSSTSGALKFSLTPAGNYDSYYRFQLSVASKLRLEHGSQLGDFSTDEIVSENGERFNFQTALDSGLSHSNVGNSYKVYNSTATSFRNTGGRFQWEAANSALAFDVRVLNDHPTSNSDHYLYIDTSVFNVAACESHSSLPNIPLSKLDLSSGVVQSDPDVTDTFGPEVHVSNAGFTPDGTPIDVVIKVEQLNVLHSLYFNWLGASANGTFDWDGAANRLYEFTLKFYESGTSTAVALNTVLTATDIDGDCDYDQDSISDNSACDAFPGSRVNDDWVSIADGSYYNFYYNTPTLLYDFVSGSDRIFASSGSNNAGISGINGISPNQSTQQAYIQLENKSSFKFKYFSGQFGGLAIDLKGDYFTCATPPDLIDFGDAPDSYGTTLLANGARHSFESTNTVYLGSNPPDNDSDAFFTSNAGGDDADNSDDEDAFVTLPNIDSASTTYSLNIPCAGSGTVAGWVDFNQSGTFEIGERQAAVCNSGSASLSWSGLSGLSAGQTYARFRIASNASEVANPMGVASDGEVEDYPVSITAAVCNAFIGEVTETNLPITTKLKTNDKLFVPSKSATSPEGHLRAYSINESGIPSSTADWDAADQMTASGRAAKLYSTDANGNKILFKSLDDQAFGSTGTVVVSTVKDYTIDPATGPVIMMTRSSTGSPGSSLPSSFLGGISRGNSLEILSNEINTSLYLYDTTYRDFFTNTVKDRKKRVLMTSDDGFLYAFDYETGNLAWGWMPRSLAGDLYNRSGFQEKHLMAGSVDILDLKDGSGNYATYVVGSYKSGLGHYVLKLDSDGNLSSIVWDEDQSGVFNRSPNNGEIEFFSDGSGIVHAIFIMTTRTDTSRVAIKSLTSSNPAVEVNLSYEVTSSPFVMQDYGKSNAPKKKTLYVGTDIGNIHAAGLLTAGGSIKSNTTILTDLENIPVSTMDDSATDAVTYISASVSVKDNKYYLSAQTATRLTVLKYDASSTSWKKKWTSYVSGAGSWSDPGGTYSADNSGVPSDRDGFAMVPPSGIPSLPVDANITDKAVIVADNLVLPLSVLPASSTACYGKAYYYMYSLVDGTFPKASFFKTDNTAIDTNIVLGYGKATRLTISDLLTKDKLVGYGISDQRADFSIKLGAPFVIKDPVTAGIRSWKELGR